MTERHDKADDKNAARRERIIKNPHSVTSAFSKLWRCRAAKSNPLIFTADSIGGPRSLLPSTPSVPEAREDPKLSLAAEVLRRRGTVHLELRGTSMLPSLWPGDLLTIQSAACDEVVPGDIVLVLRDNRFFVHRLVERRQSQDCPSWITRGDAIRHNDAPVAASDLLGRVARIRRANRSFVPSRRLSLLHSALAGMLFRWDGFRNLALRIHGALLRVGSTFAGQLFRGVFGALRRIPSISPTRTSHQ